MNVNALAASGLRSTAGAAPAPQDAPSSDSFANLLEREQAPSPDPSAESTAPADEGLQASERQAAQRARSAKGAARPVERPATRPAPTTEHTPDREATAPKDVADDAAAPATSATPADPALLHWLQGLNLPAAPASGTAGPAARAAGSTTAAPASDACEGGDAQTPAPATGSASTARAGAREHRVDAAGDRAGLARELQALRGEVVAQAETARAVEGAAPRFQDTLAALRAPSAESAAVAAPAAATTAAPIDPAAQVAQATLPVPLDDPQFPRAFGVQVSVLAREGVQQADLHLNPAEMGPVSVQIVMDGTQARIDFGADAAPTRALIEQSLPDLAAALREAGLTLAGGGVSQHAGGRDAGGTAAGPAPHAGSARTGRIEAGGGDAPAPLPRRTTVRAGGVDLYA
jgi:flagellar hook-length control protein FliK